MRLDFSSLQASFFGVLVVGSWPPAPPGVAAPAGDNGVGAKLASSSAHSRVYPEVPWSKEANANASRFFFLVMSDFS